MYSTYKVFAVLGANKQELLFLINKKLFKGNCPYFFVHTYLQLITVRVPRNYEDNIPVDYESELRVSNLSFKGSLTRDF
jgi:hypothetical protein